MRPPDRGNRLNSAQTRRRTHFRARQRVPVNNGHPVNLGRDPDTALKRADAGDDSRTLQNSRPEGARAGQFNRDEDARGGPAPAGATG